MYCILFNYSSTALQPGELLPWKLLNHLPTSSSYIQAPGSSMILRAARAHRKGGARHHAAIDDLPRKVLARVAGNH